MPGLPSIPNTFPAVPKGGGRDWDLSLWSRGYLGSPCRADSSQPSFVTAPAQGIFSLQTPAQPFCLSISFPVFIFPRIYAGTPPSLDLLNLGNEECLFLSAREMGMEEKGGKVLTCSFPTKVNILWL